MKRETNTLLGLALFLAIAPFAFSQDGNPQPCPDVTGTLGCELVAWSQLQEPVPLPEPDTRPVPPPDQQRRPQPGQSASSPGPPIGVPPKYYRDHRAAGREVRPQGWGQHDLPTR